MPTFLPEGNVALPSDDVQRSLHKIVDLVGGGTGSASSAQMYTGAAPPAAPANTSKAAIFYPDGSGSIQTWDVPSQQWL